MFHQLFPSTNNVSQAPLKSLPLALTTKDVVLVHVALPEVLLSDHLALQILPNLLKPLQRLAPPNKT
jgi:hypothetical protein